MRPAYSVISFSTALGMGYGLLVLLGVFASGETIPSDRWLGLAALGVAFGAVTFGLVSWTFRPDRPQGAFPAWSQWRTSWTSRAGVLASATYVPGGLFAIGWIGYAEVGGIWRVCGLAAAVLAGFTVHAACMIHATRHEVPAWCNRWTVPLHLALALFSGALWLQALLALFGRASPGSTLIVVMTLFLSFYLKRRYWRFIDAIGAEPASETGYRLAREQAVRLRRYAFVLLFALPLALTMAATEAAPWPAALAAVAAALSGSAGVVIERWLFFAEAK